MKSFWINPPMAKVLLSAISFSGAASSIFINLLTISPRFFPNNGYVSSVNLSNPLILFQPPITRTIPSSILNLPYCVLSPKSIPYGDKSLLSSIKYLLIALSINLLNISIFVWIFLYCILYLLAYSSNVSAIFFKFSINWPINICTNTTKNSRAIPILLLSSIFLDFIIVNASFILLKISIGGVIVGL